MSTDAPSLYMTGYSDGVGEISLWNNDTGQEINEVSVGPGNFESWMATNLDKHGPYGNNFTLSGEGPGWSGGLGSLDPPGNPMANAWNAAGRLHGMGWPTGMPTPLDDGIAYQQFERGSITLSSEGSPSFSVEPQYCVAIFTQMSTTPHRYLGMRLPIKQQVLCDIYHGPPSANQMWIIQPLTSNTGDGVVLRCALDPRFLLGVSQSLPRLPSGGYAVDGYMGAVDVFEAWQTWDLPTPGPGEGVIIPVWQPPRDGKVWFPGGTYGVLGVVGAVNADTKQVDLYPWGENDPLNQRWIVVNAADAPA